MNFGRYTQVLSIDGIKSVLTICMALKVPIAMAPAVLTLLAVEGLHLGFWQAGLILALWTTGVSVGAPVLGRFLDHHGIRPVFLLVAAAQAAFWGLASSLSYPLLAVAALLSGGLLVSGSTVARLAISGLIPEEDRHTAFAIESMMTNLAYLAGPALGVFIATQFSSSFAVLVTGALLLLGCALLFIHNPPIGLGRKGQIPGTSPSYKKAPIIAVMICAVTAGAIASGSEIGIIATLRSVDETAWSGLVMSVCAVSSLVGGLAYGSRQQGLPPSILIALLGAATIPIGFVGDWHAMMLAVIPASILIAPSFASIAAAVSVLAPSHARASVMSLLSSSMTAGMSLGAPLAGAAFDTSNSVGCFGAVGGLGVLIAAVTWKPLRAGLRKIEAEFLMNATKESKEEV